nr:MAG TPA: hypothetical protein [Caudoviricetes sp.]
MFLLNQKPQFITKDRSFLLSVHCCDVNLF